MTGRGVNRLMWRRLVTPPAILAGSLVVLLSAVVLGVSISGLRLFPPFGGRTQLGRSLGRTGIVPLTDRYVDQVLGPDEALSGPRLARVGGLQPRGLGGGHDPGGEVVVHPLTNNDRGDAYPVSRLPFTGRTSTAEADRETGEPGCGTQLGGTVWYRYRAVASERLLADTFTSNYQTSLAAYRNDGATVTQLACDTDASGNAQIAVSVSAGATYLFQIGAAVTGGDMVFHLGRFGAISLASRASDGRQGDDWSYEPSLSYDGRYVAFTSYSENLTREDVRAPSCLPWDFFGPCPNIFLRDRAGTTRLVSITIDGLPANAESANPQVSDDGRYVAFASAASNLVEGDENAVRDIFVRDMSARRTERVSVTSAGGQAAPGSGSAFRSGDGRVAISGDGRYVAFDSNAPNLDPRDTNGSKDVFVRDRLSGVTSLACLDHRDRPTPRTLPLISDLNLLPSESNPVPSGPDCSLEGISRNGRWVLFHTAFPMTADDHDNASDVFLRDLHLGMTERVSGAPGGQAPNGSAVLAVPVPQRSISDDGRFVVFGSNASNLVPGDTNAATDVFVHDRATRRTERVSVSSSGAQGMPPSGQIYFGGRGWSISGDGRHVALASSLTGLVPDDGDRAHDVFIHDRSTKTTLRLSFVGRGGENEATSDSPRVSGDGSAVAFRSDLKLTDDDANGVRDIFIYQRRP